MALLTLPAFAQQQSDIETVEVISQHRTNQLTADIQTHSDTSPDFRSTIAKMPGMAVNGNGPLTGIAQYRGLFGDRLSITIDGSPITGAGPNAMDSPMAHLIPGPFTQATLLRGIAPVSSGNETLAGTLTITHDIDAQLNAENGLSGQAIGQMSDQGNAKHLSASLQLAGDNRFISISGLSQRGDNGEDGRGQIIPNSFYERTAAGINTGIQFAKHQLNGSYQVINTKPTGTAALAMDIDFIDAAFYRLGYQYNLSEQETLSFNISGNSNQHDMNNFAHRNIASMMMARLNSVDSLHHGYEAKWQRQSDNLNMSAGLSWDDNQHNSTIQNPLTQTLTIKNFNGVKRNLKSAFFEFNNTAADFVYGVGARYTQVNTNAGAVSHSMAMMNPAIANLVESFNQTNKDLSYNLLDIALHSSYVQSSSWQWQAAIGRKNRAPSYTELYVWFPLGISAGMADGFNYLGNLALKEERADQFDFGFTYHTKSINLAPRAFYQKIHDYIVGDTSNVQAANMVSNMMNNNPLLQWQNVDVTLWGVDVILNAQLADDWRLDATAQWVRATRDDLNQPLYRISPATLTSRLCWCDNSKSIAIESELVAGQNQVSLIQNESKSAGYGLVHLSADLQFNDNIGLTLRVNNLMDKAYQSHLAGVNRVNSTQVPMGEKLYGIGRSLSASIQVSW